MLLASIVFFLCSSCTTKEQAPDQALLQGSWRGTLTYKHINEVKTYAPMLEDSLTSLVDTMIIIPDVGVDIANTEARFWNIQPLNTSIFLYEWDNKTVKFQKKKETNDAGSGTSHTIQISLDGGAYEPYAVITKLDADSLVLQLAVFTDSENEYLLKLKRK